MDEFRGLFPQRLYQGRVAVPQAVYGNSRTKVQVLFPPRVPKLGPLPPRDSYRQPVIGIHKNIIHNISSNILPVFSV
jgi:hypothetical protein